MTDGSAASAEPADGDWLDVSDAALRIGFDSDTILKLIHDGDMPVMQVAGQVRTAHRVPRCLIEDARAVVMSGGQVELRAFAREWPSRPVVVAVA